MSAAITVQDGKLIEDDTPRAPSLWDAAVMDYRSKKESGRLKLEDITTIFVVGTKSAGKTSLINRLLEKNETPKPTLALDFTFARRTTADLTKEVCHIWELGGDAMSLSQLIETPIRTNHCLEKMSIFIVVDLSVPEKIWPTIEIVSTTAKRAITRALSAMSNQDEMTQILERRIISRLGEDCQDKTLLEPLPLPVVIIGTKYDIFQNFEPEKRKTICRILRLASHKMGASLNSYTKQDVSLCRRMRELLSHYAFDTPFPKGICVDSNKALMIPHGSDSYESIWPGAPPAQFTMDFFKHLYESQIGKFNEKLVIPDDPVNDQNFREAEIDSRRNMILEDITLAEKVRQEFSTSQNTII